MHSSFGLIVIGIGEAGSAVATGAAGPRGSKRQRLPQ
jgi:hypothetical protein